MARSNSSLGLIENISELAEGKSKIAWSEATAARRSQWVVDPEANSGENIFILHLEHIDDK